MKRARDVADLSDVFLKCRTWGAPLPYVRRFATVRPDVY